jgi:hypothetical protein
MFFKITLDGPPHCHWHHTGNDNSAQNVGDQQGEIERPDHSFATKLRKARIGLVNDIKDQKQGGCGEGADHGGLVALPVAASDKGVGKDQKNYRHAVQRCDNVGEVCDFHNVRSGHLDNDANVHKSCGAYQYGEQNPFIHYLTYFICRYSTHE